MIKVNLKELERLPALLVDVSEKAAKRAIAKSLRETIRATRKAAIDAVRAANVVNLKASELRAGASERVVTKRDDYGNSSTARMRSRGGFPYFGSEISKPSAPIDDAFATFRISEYKINLFRFFAKRVRVGKTTRLWDGKFIKPSAAGKNVKKYTFSTYGARVRVLGREYVAGRGFIMKRGRAGIIIERNPGVQRKEREHWGRKLWGPSISSIVDARGVTRAAFARGMEVFERAIVRNLAFFAKKHR